MLIGAITGGIQNIIYACYIVIYKAAGAILGTDELSKNTTNSDR